MTDPTAFATRYPRLYHATFAENLDLIHRYGLMTAEDLLHRAGREATDIEELLAKPRSKTVSVVLPTGEIVLIRDQKPLRTVHLARRFPDIDLRAYVRNLSRRVFFWADPAKATVSKARECAQVAQATLVFDTAALLRDHAERIELCRVNSGTLLMPSAVGGRENRDPATMFMPLRQAPWRPDEAKEVTLLGSLIDARRFIVAVESSAA